MTTRAAAGSRFELDQISEHVGRGGARRVFLDALAELTDSSRKNFGDRGRQ